MSIKTPAEIERLYTQVKDVLKEALPGGFTAGFYQGNGGVPYGEMNLIAPSAPVGTETKEDFDARRSGLVAQRDELIGKIAEYATKPEGNGRMLPVKVLNGTSFGPAVVGMDHLRSDEKQRAVLDAAERFVVRTAREQDDSDLEKKAHAAFDAVRATIVSKEGLGIGVPSRKQVDAVA